MATNVKEMTLTEMARFLNSLELVPLCHWSETEGPEILYMVNIFTGAVLRAMETVADHSSSYLEKGNLRHQFVEAIDQLNVAEADLAGQQQIVATSLALAKTMSLRCLKRTTLEEDFYKLIVELGETKKTIEKLLKTLPPPQPDRYRLLIEKARVTGVLVDPEINQTLLEILDYLCVSDQGDAVTAGYPKYMEGNEPDEALHD